MHGARAVLGGAATQAGIAVAAGGDGAGDDPLAFLKALNLRAELLDHAYRLVAYGQAPGHRIFATQDVHIGAADRCGGDSHQCIQWADIRDGLFFQHDSVLLNENCRFHERHGTSPEALRDGS